MVNHYTAARRIRSDDAYSPAGEAVADHAEGVPAEDDRTLVVMRYQPEVSGPR